MAGGRVAHALELFWFSIATKSRYSLERSNFRKSCHSCRGVMLRSRPRLFTVSTQNRSNQFDSIIGFRDYILEPKHLRVVHHLLRCIQRIQNDFRFRREGSYLGCGSKAVQKRHLIIQDHDVGVEFFDLFDRLRTIFRFAAHIPCRILLDECPERSANGEVIIGDENSVRQTNSISPLQAAGKAKFQAPTGGDQKGKVQR